MRNGIRMPSPAMLVAVVALFVALGGSALAVTAAKNSVKSKSIKNGQVKTKDLANAAVNAQKLADAAVGTAKLTDNAVSTQKLADGSVTTPKLADGAVATDKIADNAVSTAKIADDSVTTAKIPQSAVTGVKLANGSVSSGKIEDAALTAGKFYRATNHTFNAPPIAAHSCTTDTVAGNFADIQATDRIFVGYPDGINALAVVRGTTANGSITITVCNIDDAAIDPDNHAYPILIVRQ